MILLTILKILFSFMSAINADIPNIQSNVLVSKTVYGIIDKFYVIKSPKMYLIQSASSNVSYFIQSDIVNEILHHSQNKITLKIEDISALKSEKQLKSYNIVFIDSYESFT